MKDSIFYFLVALCLLVPIHCKDGVPCTCNDPTACVVSEKTYGLVTCSDEGHCTLGGKCICSNGENCVLDEGCLVCETGDITFDAYCNDCGTCADQDGTSCPVTTSTELTSDDVAETQATSTATLGKSYSAGQYYCMQAVCTDCGETSTCSFPSDSFGFVCRGESNECVVDITGSVTGCTGVYASCCAVDDENCLYAPQHNSQEEPQRASSAPGRPYVAYPLSILTSVVWILLVL